MQRLTSLQLDAVEASRVLMFADGGQNRHPLSLLAPPAPSIRGIIEQHGSDMAMHDMDIWLGLTHALTPIKTNGHNQDEVNLPALLVNVSSLLQWDRVIVHKQTSAAPHAPFTQSVLVSGEDYNSVTSHC